MPPEEVLREVRRWLAKAEGDLRAITLLMEANDPPLDIVCFHAQQAAEKYVKGHLTFLGLPFPKSHDLEELVARQPAEQRITLDVDALAELSQLAVAPRYPDWEDPVDREAAERARRTCEAVKGQVLAALAAAGFTA